MENQSTISDHWLVPSKTVIEVARRAARLSQRRLAVAAKTKQSSISEYERRRKSPTLEVVERLLDAADHELVARPTVFWEVVRGPDAASFWVPERLWAVPVPTCFAKVEAFRYVFPDAATQDWKEYIRTWDLSVTSERIDYYELAVRWGIPRMIEASVDGLLLVQAWPHMTLPVAVRRAWQPIIDKATTYDGPAVDPGGVNEWMAGEIKLEWPLAERWRGAIPPSP